ncbi:conjugal transfer protein TrbJ [Salmonella enterica]|nr:conjugal transfer protein TrbJ [Salmonella enterica subsp. enterica]EGT7896346.1 conjugal transfer protein TrbJ [Salmonella enterica]EHW1157769.1 conjugal transfer protein TrbJ [Salmonella enterica subsp. enterica serovar Takoradi]EIP0099106.1 conjugal transfer protein TrbJ [Salmonella enterica subsp. enterica serovar Wangata]ECJ4936639.1 conjugal transfer protein TrbJ [Salmonella enterica subsp. enterica]
MCPADRIQFCNERQISLEERVLVDMVSTPACIRNSDGDFITYNAKFYEEIIQLTNIKEWLYSLPVQVATALVRKELDAMSLPSSIFKIKHVNINGKFWCVQFLPLINNDKVSVLWLFFNDYLNAEITFSNNLYSKVSHEKIMAFKKWSTKIQWKVFILHCHGFKHGSISSLLSIKNGVSRNAVTEINKFFGVNSKHQLLMLFHGSGMYDLFLKELYGILWGWK